MYGYSSRLGIYEAKRFEIKSGLKHSLDMLQASKVVESLSFIMKDYGQQAKMGGWTFQLFKEFDSIVTTAELDLSQLLAAQRAVEAPDLDTSMT